MISSPRLIALFMLFPLTVGAGMYKWQDEAGVTHYSNTPPPASVKKAKEVKGGSVSSFVPGSAGAPAAGGKLDHLQGPPPSASVELFTTTWCGYCTQAKSYLASRGVPYQEFDVESNPAAAARARSYGWTGGVPFALIGGQPVRGFSAGSYDRVLASSQKR